MFWNMAFSRVRSFCYVEEKRLDIAEDLSLNMEWVTYGTVIPHKDVCKAACTTKNSAH